MLTIGSNHPRRKKIIDIAKKYKSNTYNKQYLVNLNQKNFYIFFGNSHSEFYSRNYEKNGSFMAFYTGAHSLIDLCKDNEIVKTLNNLSKILTFLFYKKNIFIILCFGEITVRYDFYKLKFLSKKYTTFKDVIDKLKIKLNFILSKINYKKIYFISPPPVSNKNFYTPIDLYSLKQNNLNLPNLGNLKFRISVNKKINILLKEISKKNNFYHINTEKIFSSPILNKKISIDGCHITNRTIISRIQKRVKIITKN